MERVLVAVLLMLSLMSAADGAQAATSRCEGCSESQFTARAKQLGEGQHIITSFSTNEIRTFEVRDMSGGEPGAPTRLFASPVSVSAQLQNLFSDARHFYAMTGGTLKYGVIVRGDDLGVPGLKGATAYNVMSNFNLKSQLADRLATGTLPGWTNLDRAGEQIAQGLFALVGAGNASIEIAVEMSDGSIVVYRLDTNSSTGQYLVDKSRTKTGQAIPEANMAAYQGNWAGGADQPGLMNYLQGLGIPVNTAGSGQSYGGMTCTWDGKTLNCKVKKE